MTDTSRVVAMLVAERHRAMSGEERWQVASSMFETAQAIVEPSLPDGLSPQERRAALARRLYGAELTSEAVAAFAAFPGSLPG